MLRTAIKTQKITEISHYKSIYFPDACCTASLFNLYEQYHESMTLNEKTWINNRQKQKEAEVEAEIKLTAENIEEAHLSSMKSYMSQIVFGDRRTRWCRNATRRCSYC